MSRAFQLVDAWPTAASIVIVTADGQVARHGDQRSVIRLASVTKALVSMSTWVAIEEGSARLDDRVGPPGSTLHHLLSHCSGLNFDDGQVITRPGTRRIYSNTGWDLAAAHLAEMTGIATSTYLHEAVFAPLGMSSTVLHGSPSKDVHGCCADLEQVCIELLHPTLVSPSTIADATTTQFPGLSGILPGVGRFDPLDWGLGVQVNWSASMPWAATHLSARSFGHFGATGTFLWVDPMAGVAVACLTGTEFGPWALEHWPVFGDAVLDEHGR
ncbi:MAG: serine hydrolase domain-containing protein [Acidimicrobiia bacterium]